MLEGLLLLALGTGLLAFLSWLPQKVDAMVVVSEAIADSDSRPWTAPGSIARSGRGHPDCNVASRRPFGLGVRSIPPD